MNVIQLFQFTTGSMTENSVRKLGFWSALVAFVVASGFSVAQILQIVGIVSYPWDSILIYGFSLFIATPFMLALLALHHVTSDEKRFWSHATILFAVMYTTYVTLNYVVQLTAVIPYVAPNPVLVQTPHSLFWTVDALGYTCMGYADRYYNPVSYIFSIISSASSSGKAGAICGTPISLNG